MKKIYYILVLLMSVTLFSCDDFLDIQPKGYTIPNYYNDYAKLMNHQALIRVVSGYPNYLTDDVLAGLTTDVVKGAIWTTINENKRRLYTFDHGEIFLPGNMDPNYEGPYWNIYMYNVVINNIMNTPDGTLNDKKTLRAEALFGRAFVYLCLVNSYAPHYDPATAKTDLGVPLVLSEDIGKKYVRNSVAEVYEQILKDINEAIPDLATSVPNNFRPSKGVGYAFLSKVQLYMGKYNEALANAKEALKLNSFLMDYKNYTTRKGYTFTRIGYQDGANFVPFPEMHLNKESIWIRFGSPSQGSINAEVYVSKDLQNVFAADLPVGAVDKRRALFFCENSATFSTKTINFPGRWLYAPYLETNAGCGTPEIYLIAAECEARVGNKDQAMQYLNTLRNSRISGNTPLVATSNDNALELVLRERRRELCYNGIVRLVDLKRLNKDTRFAKEVSHMLILPKVVNGVTTNDTTYYKLPANDKRYVLPLPPKVIEFNPTIPQLER